MTTEGVVTTYTGSAVDYPGEITTGPDGALWYTNAGDWSIGRITTAGTCNRFTDPSIRWPEGIVSGPDGALWFTNLDGNSIGRISTGGVVSNFTASGIEYPRAITAGADGALWFTNYTGGAGAIGRIATAGFGDRVPGRWIAAVDCRGTGWRSLVHELGNGTIVCRPRQHRRCRHDVHGHLRVRRP